jgi:hypothetical protein
VAERAGRPVGRPLAVDRQAESADPGLPAFLARPPGAPVYHGFPFSTAPRPAVSASGSSPISSPKLPRKATLTSSLRTEAAPDWSGSPGAPPTSRKSSHGRAPMGRMGGRWACRCPRVPRRKRATTWPHCCRNSGGGGSLGVMHQKDRGRDRVQPQLSRCTPRGRIVRSRRRWRCIKIQPGRLSAGL